MTLELLHQIDFGSDGDDINYVGIGWAEPEVGFRWAIGPRSELWLEHPGMAGDGFILELDLSPFCSPPRLPAQRLTVRVRGQVVGRSVIDTGRKLAYLIRPRAIAGRGPLRIQFEHRDATPPVQCGIDDERPLAFAFKQASLYRVSGQLEGVEVEEGQGISTDELERITGVDPAQFIVQFESLGDNPEFGIVQRRCGSESDGLLRFSNLTLEALEQGLSEEFQGLGEQSRLSLYFSDGKHREYVCRDNKLALTFPTSRFEDEVSEADLMAEQSTRLRVLREKFLEDLRAGKKIFVFKRNAAVDLDNVKELFSVLNRFGPNKLLWVVEASTQHAAGTVERIAPSLYAGYIDRFAPYDDSHDLSFDVWLALCHKAHELAKDDDDGRQSNPAAAASTVESAPHAIRGTDESPGNIVFVGNCQLDALAKIYRHLAPRADHGNVTYIESYNEATEAQRRIIAGADLLVQQVLDFAPRIGDLHTEARVHFVPHITAAFLWPFSGEAHPRNSPEPMLDASGPYPPELGDSFLNKLIGAGVAPSEATERYAGADVPSLRRVDRMMELFLEKQRSRDRACGYEFADFIESRFRSTCLFRSPNHPDITMTKFFVMQVFSRLEVDPTALDHFLDDGHDHFFPASETPIHPSVASHFDLSFAPAERRYTYFNEGKFTFQEYVERYMRYEWNALLAEGVHSLNSGNIAGAVEALIAAMPGAPRAAGARIMLADALERLGDLDQALIYALEAVEIEPGNQRYSERLMEIADHRLTRKSATTAAAGASP